MSDTYIAWNGDEYPMPPPEGWEIRADGRYWPSDSGHVSSTPEPNPAPAPQPLPRPWPRQRTRRRPWHARRRRRQGPTTRTQTRMLTGPGDAPRTVMVGCM